MAAKDDTACVGSTSEDIVEEEVKNKSLRTDVTLKVKDKVDEETEEDIVEEEEEFKNKSWRTDVTLKVEDRLFYANKLVLGLASPVFEAMFSGENTEEDISAISLSGKKYSDVLEFLRCIYPNVMKPVTMDTIFSVLPLAVEYQVTSLKKTCESFLLKRLDEDISTELLCTILDIAHTYKVKRVFDKGEQIAITRPRVDIDKAFSKASLPGDVTSKILNKICISIETENQNLRDENTTARALCSYLGCVAKQSPLVNRFLKGNVTGKSFSLAVNSSSFGKSFDICLVPFIFAVRFDQTHETYCRKLIPIIRTFMKCSNLNRASLNCVCAVILKNWRTDKTDIVEENALCFKQDDPSDKEMKVLETKASSEVFNESNGFIYKEVFNLEICLFIEHK